MEHQIKLQRMPIIDNIKGVMILFVIITHFRWEYPSDFLKYGFVYYIDMAVPVFMVLSSYLAALSGKNHRLVSEMYSLDYMLKKWLRFIIPFLIAFFIEIPFLIKEHYDFLYIIKRMFIGGGGAWILLYSNYVAVCSCISNDLLYHEKTQI